MSEDRLSRIEQLLIQTAEIASENSRALQMQRTINAEYDRQSQKRMDNLMQVVEQSAQHQDQVNDELSKSLQILIDEGNASRASVQQQLQTYVSEGKEYRAQSQQEITAFREAVNALITQISARLNQIAERIEQLSDRINAA